jgi:hypothetical protein
MGVYGGEHLSQLFVLNLESKELPLDELVMWDSFSYNVSVTTFYELAGATMQYISRRKVKRKGKYLFTIDWCAGDFNELNFWLCRKTRPT